MLAGYPTVVAVVNVDLLQASVTFASLVIRMELTRVIFGSTGTSVASRMR